MDLTPGQIIGNDYRVVQLLAAGGMGAVYVAEQLSTGKRRALKVMHRDLASDAESQRRFLQEARVGSLIASEHVVEVQNAGIDPATGHPFLVMELLEGEDLQASLHVKVLDFGIAKILENQNATAAVGTPMWLAPEQTERGHITSAADVWAFGLVVFTMLTGGCFWKTPARNGTLIELLSEILRDPIPLASARAAELGRSLPPNFDAWFLRCVSRPPSGRFPNAREAHAALVPILEHAARPLPQPTVAFAPAASARGPALAPVAPVAAYFGKVFEAAPKPTFTALTGVAQAGAPPPQPQPVKETGSVHVMVMSDDPRVQTELVSDATLSPKVEQCVAPVRANKQASIVIVFEVSSAGVKPVMTQAQPMGPHVQCVTNVISNRPLSTSKKRASLQVMVTWS